MVSKDEKTLILTSASETCEELFIEWLVSLRTLGNYHGKVMALDYGIGNRAKMLATKLGAKLYHCKPHNWIDSTISKTVRPKSTLIYYAQSLIEPYQD